MKLIIAEKPSVAAAIAQIVGADQRQNGYYEGAAYIVSWCVGHLVELAMPSAYDKKYEHWNVEDLPLIPDQFQTVVSAKTAQQFAVLKSLMFRNDVTELIEATDAGREGELIFRLVYKQAGCHKPFKRLWISSLEDSAIRDGMANLRDSHEYDNLYFAAMARQRADWLVGINASRLYTSMYRRKLSVGRVQTPTLQLIVQRWLEHSDFIPKPYYRLCADMGAWHLYHQEDNKQFATELQQRCIGSNATIRSVEKKEKRSNAPALYDLTTLQRDANRLLGYSAQQTLDYLQSLYDKKLATYPRTDSRYLTHDMEGSTEQLLSLLLEEFPAISGRVSADSFSVAQVINDDKVSDHHAILPTRQLNNITLSELPTGEKNIATLITLRLFSAVSAPHIYTLTSVKADIGGAEFAATGHTDLQLGYKVLDNVQRTLLALKEQEKKEPAENIPELCEDQTFPVLDCTVQEKKTTPPPLYTEDTLLAAMETAGKQLDDPELREAMKDSGLGTPATRAGIIEGIIKTGYVERKKKALLPTQAGITLVDMVAPELKSPELTGQWEHSLSYIADGKVTSTVFLQQIAAYTRRIIEAGKQSYNATAAQQLAVPDTSLGKCPLCGREVKPNKIGYGCTGYRDTANPCKWMIWKEIAGKKISEATVKRILSDRRSSLIKGFTARSGKKFDAFLILKEDGGIGFDFPKRK